MHIPTPDCVLSWSAYLSLLGCILANGPIQVVVVSSLKLLTARVCNSNTFCNIMESPPNDMIYIYQSHSDSGYNIIRRQSWSTIQVVPNIINYFTMYTKIASHVHDMRSTIALYVDPACSGRAHSKQAFLIKFYGHFFCGPLKSSWIMSSTSSGPYLMYLFGCFPLSNCLAWRW